jgi:hypothetical protein
MYCTHHRLSSFHLESSIDVTDINEIREKTVDCRTISQMLLGFAVVAVFLQEMNIKAAEEYKIAKNDCICTRSRVRDSMRWMNFFNLPNPSGRTRPLVLLSL